MTQLQSKKKKKVGGLQSGQFGSLCSPIALAHKSGHRPNVAIWRLGKNRTVLMRKLYVPEWSKHNHRLYSVVTSLPRTPASLPRHLLCTFYVFVEPFGEFSSRRTQKNMKRKQLLTQKLKHYWATRRQQGVATKFKNLASPTHRPHSPADTCAIILVIL